MLVVEAMKVVGDSNRVDRDRVRRTPLRRFCSDHRKLGEPLDQVTLLALELVRRGDAGASSGPGVPEDARDARMRVLHVVDRILLRALGCEVDVDVDRLVVPTG